jgi:hypothetical protein
MNDTPRWIRTSSLAALLVLALVPAARAQARNAMPHLKAQGAAMRHNSGRQGMMMGPAYSYRNQNANVNANQNNGQLVSELHSTMLLLAQAQHDYQGHRVRAIHQIGNAIRTLEPASVRRNQANAASSIANIGNANGTGAGNKNRMPQATSDGHLQTALQRLNTIENQLTNFGSTSHHARARLDVQKAIQELNLALNIR